MKHCTKPPQENEMHKTFTGKCHIAKNCFTLQSVTASVLLTNCNEILKKKIIMIG